VSQEPINQKHIHAKSTEKITHRGHAYRNDKNTLRAEKEK